MQRTSSADVVTTAGARGGLFDLSIPKILVLGVLGLVIFGPEQLPRLAAQAGQALRDLRRLADRARADLNENLGPEFADFDFNDLNPKAFVRKHLLEDLDDGSTWDDPAEIPALDPASELVEVPAGLVAGEIPPYDREAT